MGAVRYSRRIDLGPFAMFIGTGDAGDQVIIDLVTIPVGGPRARGLLIAKGGYTGMVVIDGQPVTIQYETAFGDHWSKLLPPGTPISVTMEATEPDSKFLCVHEASMYDGVAAAPHRVGTYGQPLKAGEALAVAVGDLLVVRSGDYTINGVAKSGLSITCAETAEINLVAQTDVDAWVFRSEPV